jgi:AP2 domain
MKTVPLYGAKAAGRVALVDDDDYDLVMRYRWYVHEQVKRPGRRSLGPYAVVTAPRLILMHRLITGYARTDHINHDTLDNRRANLRAATHVQNMRNQRPWVKASSRFKGVTWDRSHSKWRARIWVGDKCHHLGRFTSEEEAARAYDEAARELFGEYAYLNFTAA